MLPERDRREHAAAAHKPAGVVHHATTRRIPFRDHHDVGETDKTDSCPRGHLGTDTVVAPHNTRPPHPLALAGPVDGGLPHLLGRRPDKHARGDLQERGHVIRRTANAADETDE